MNDCEHCWHPKFRKHGPYVESFSSIDPSVKVCCHCGIERVMP